MNGLASLSGFSTTSQQSDDNSLIDTFFRIGDDKANDATVLVVIRKKNENVEEGSVQNRDRKRLAPLMVTVSVWLCLMEH